MSLVPVINHPCTVCCRPTSMWCSRCQTTWYCSQEHLQTDWPCHREECAPVSHVQDYDRIATLPPMGQQFITVSAILFPPEEERPRIIQIQCRPDPLKVRSQGNCPRPVVTEHIPDEHTEGIVLTQALNPFQSTFHLWYSPAAWSRGAPVNRAISNITSSSAWYGAVVVLKFKRCRKEGYSDASLNDLRALSTHLRARR